MSEVTGAYHKEQLTTLESKLEQAFNNTKPSVE